jgi:hypothetical protein
MATLTTVNSTEYANAYVTEPNVKNDVSLLSGRVRRAYASYTLAAADILGTAGLINMFKLPKGARIVDAYVESPDSGLTGIFEVGWDGGTNGDETADPNGIFTSQDSGTAAITVEMDKSIVGWNRKFADEVTIQIDYTEATESASELVIELEVQYVVD